jgi:Tfp pilus assembly protein PilN
MKDIDFLPSHYRLEHAARRKRVSGVAVVLVYAALLAVAAYTQHARQRRMKGELETLSQQHAAVTAQAAQLAAMQQESRNLDAIAALATWLRHPWPRTQLLAAVLDPLPQSVQLDDLSLQRSGAQESNVRRTTGAANATKEADTRTPAERDLDTLRARFDADPVAITLSGTTTEIARLHVYLAALGETGLFSEVKLVSLERDGKGDTPVSRFRARATVAPGYGQPGAKSEQTSVAKK